MNEKLLLTEFQKGNQKAFNTLYNNYYKVLVVYAKQFVKDLQIAENLTQDVFVMVYEKREQLQIHTSFKAFMYTSLRNHCLNYLKKENRFSSFEDSQIKIIEENNIDDPFIKHAELAQKLHDAIHKLPKKNQQIFRMSRFEGATNEDIADNLGLTKRTVETHISNALKKLRHHLVTSKVILFFIFDFFTCILIFFVLHNT